MKKIFVLIGLFTAALVQAQDFKKNVAVAKTSYNSNKLEDAHFALQQALTELDITIGKEVLKLLPAKMDTMKVNAKEDNVSGNMGFVGATIHRLYGMGQKQAEIDIVNNSPMLAGLNAFLTNPMLANMGNDGKSRSLKVQDFKARLTRDEGDNNSNDYRLEIPLNNAMITFNVKNSNENEVLAMINTIPLDKISKLIQ